MRGLVAALVLIGVLGACDGAADPALALDAGPASLEALRDPETCKGCHLEHYREWASSMHAYSARDPVFIAMNERGQLETKGALGDFCIKCHAPMALELGLTSDGLNLPDLEDPSARGVTCYFCHTVTDVDGDHNRALLLAGDGVMRGGLGKGASEARNGVAPARNSAHASAYSSLHDGASKESAALCGACHDVVNDRGVALERTFAEWRGSRFSAEQDAGEHDNRDALQTCAQCHMNGYDGRAAAGAPARNLHRHLWPGVDVALESKSFPGTSAQAAAIACAFEGSLDLSLVAAPNDDEPNAFEVTLTNLRVGHGWPSGATQDRRAWVEFVAYDSDDQVIFERGVIAAGEVVGARDAELEVLRDRLYDENAKPVHMFWQAAPSQDHPDGYESDLLPAPTADGTATTRTFRYVPPSAPTRVTARLRVQSIGLDVLDDFQGIHLPISERVLNNGYQEDPTLRSKVPTITVPGSERELVVAPGAVAHSIAQNKPADCAAQAYVSLLAD